MRRNLLLLSGKKGRLHSLVRKEEENCVEEESLSGPSGKEPYLRGRRQEKSPGG